MAPKKTFGSLTAAVAFLAIGVALYMGGRQQTIQQSSPRSFLFVGNAVMNDGANEIGQRPIDNTIKVSFTLHANGDGLSEGIEINTADFSHLDEIIEAHCCSLMKFEKERCAPNSGAKLLTETGVRMLSFNDVVEGQRVYCVPQGVHFVWPMKKTGYAVYPKNVVGPVQGKPIRLKQLSETLRVFSVDNFVSPEEIEEILRSNRNRMTPSEVGFGGWQDDTRTSSTSWDFTSKAAKSIQTRTFQILGMDVQPELVGLPYTGCNFETNVEIGGCSAGASLHIGRPLWKGPVV
jgi:hypothetical protein